MRTQSLRYRAFPLAFSAFALALMLGGCGVDPTQPSTAPNRPLPAASAAQRKVQSIVITDLGALPGGARSEAYGVSSSGLIVGASHQGPDSSGHPVVWDHGDVRLLGGPSALGEARGVSPNGVAVGWSYDHAVLWKNGVAIDLPGLSGGKSTWANAINPTGEIVGLSGTSAGTGHAVLWKDGRAVDLGTLAGGWSEGMAINPAGDVAGYSLIPGHETHAFLWRRGVMRELGTPSGCDNSEARAINARGQVVGATRDVFGSRCSHAVLWDRDRVIDLGTLPGHKAAEANGISPMGDVVGSSTPLSLQTHGFLWRDGIMTDLGTLPGSDYSEARAINSGGEIVGYATAADGQWHAVRWTVR
jgi:probable HAF family extracellular repeat protein